MYQIDKNVPALPPAKSGKYPFKFMQIGDSFFVPVETFTKGEHLSSSAQNYKHIGKFSVRKVDGGYRVWRIA